MKARNKLVAGVGGVALIAGIAGMSTFALWSDTDTADAGVVVAGNLEVATVANVLDDISPDVEGAGEVGAPIGPDFRAVPGDVVRMTSEIDLGLRGDNLVATLDTTTLEEGIVAAGAEDYVTLDFQLYEADGTTPISAEADGNYRFNPASADINNGGVRVPDATDGTPDVVAKVTITFDETTPDQELQNLDLASFENAGVTLTQVRDGQGFVDVTP